MCGDPMRGPYAVPIALAVRFWTDIEGQVAVVAQHPAHFQWFGRQSTQRGSPGDASLPSRRFNARRDRSRLLAARRGLT